MTKKDYQEVAAVLRRQVEDYDNDPQTEGAIELIAWGLVDLFQADNPRFDPDKFMRAAGLEQAITPRHPQES